MSSLKLLPDSGLSSMVMGNDIYAYAQTYDGDIYQFVGNVRNSSTFIRSKRKSNVIIERLEGSAPKDDAPKLFTPIAAVSFTDELNRSMTERLINLSTFFFLDDRNILHDQYDTGNGAYQHGTLANKNIQCAHYSSLAAITIKGDVVNHMCVFYQAPTPDAAVKMVSFAGRHRTWDHDRAHLTDPPLYGTSFTAVPPRAGILGPPLPLFGYDRDGLPLAFSPHTSLTAVDNGTQLHLIYKSHTGQVKVIRIDPKEGLQLPELFFKDLDVAPRSSIAACIAPNTGADTCIVLFYQSLDPSSRKVQMAAKVVYRPSNSVVDTKWRVSEKEVLGE
ncbi:hypothetical protein P154DRAFT_546783 [Amniculicola lignicola CBS 123094]|uniref:Uncharacterized protein n=1 Tax=Amniculicola lignicola CBS 123094 TaxID=1392246 RepID=A0A6A5WC21_9PLEO|nr:hypothetical protein P154DRAFT_546783 [Amniculicola lignicola CBS 123094]